MRILFLTFYFEPDLSAGAFRATALVKALQSHLPDDVTIDVLTTLPNRYKSFPVSALETESKGVINIRRIRLPSHRSGFVDQSRAFLSYALYARKIALHHEYDFIVGTSSRLMTAFLSSQIARSIGAPLYLDIRDIFVDTLYDMKPKWLFRTASHLFQFVEDITMRRAEKVNLVSKGFEAYFRARHPEKELSFFSNGIDNAFIENFAGDPVELPQSQRPYSVIYAGNIGEGQGLHKIIPDLAAKMKDIISFRIIGDGGRRKQLEIAIAERGIQNVTIVDPVGRGELVEEYKKADVLFLHLNDCSCFKKVLPSKVFEYAATGKPIWAGVSGYSSKFILQSIENAAVFASCDVAAAEAAFLKLHLKHTPRPSFVSKYSRNTIMDDFARDILAHHSGL